MDNQTLATELLHEVKAQAKRWFIIAIAELVVIVILVLIMFFVPVDEYSVEQRASENENTQLIGGDYYGIPESDIQTQERWSAP